MKTHTTGEQKHNFFRATAIIITVLLSAALSVYFLLAFYYRGGFGLNTWINGVYCTGKTVEEVNEELLYAAEAPVIVLMTQKNGFTDCIRLEDFEFSCEYLPALEEYVEESNSLLWLDNITLHKNHYILPQITYNEGKFREAFENSLSVLSYSQAEEGCSLQYSDEEGWTFYNGLEGRLDVDKAFELIQTSLEKGQGEIVINLDGLDCFYDVPMDDEQLKIKEVWERLDAFQHIGIIYDMGDEQIGLSDFPGLVGAFIKREYREDIGGGMDYPVISSDGRFIPDETAVEEFISELADTYDTYGRERQFQSTRGDIVTIPAGGTYGTKLNQEAEVEYLMEKLQEDDVLRVIQLHVPEYEKQGMVRGKDDIGDTYIEIDMTQQKMYYYEDGELVIETDVVTGNISRRMGTPEGVNYVYNKQKNRILRGEGYASPVKFWMPVKGSIGIHDASWRSEFGGEIYKTNGSHGCINTPLDVMEELYDLVETGTPVIMFY